MEAVRCSSVPPDRIPSTVLAELDRLGVTDVVIVGGPAAVSNDVAAGIAATGRTVTRLAGANRYASAASVSSHVFGSADTVLVAVGTDFPDALAGAAISGVAGGPLLLVEADDIPGAAANELTRLSPDQIVVLGGPAAVSHWVGIQLAAYQ